MIRQFGKRGLAQDIEIGRRDTHQARQGRDKIMLRQVSSFPGSRDTETQTLTAPAPGSRSQSRDPPRRVTFLASPASQSGKISCVSLDEIFDTNSPDRNK